MSGQGGISNKKELSWDIHYKKEPMINHEMLRGRKQSSGVKSLYKDPKLRKISAP